MNEKNNPQVVVPAHLIVPLKFTIYQYADISTGYLDESDLELIQDTEITGHIAETDDLAGCYWYPSSDDDIFAAQITEWRAKGLSERFIALMRELKRQGIPYVRFDADGGEIDGLEYGDAGEEEAKG